MSRILPALLLTAALLVPHAHARAQAVESVPLSEPSYTLNKETDPMAMDPSGAAPDKTINRGTTQIAPPPPGADDMSGTSTHDTMPSPTMPPSDFSPSDSSPPPSETATGPSPDYSNNPVSGVVPSDESKFENRTFCTLKVSFTSTGSGIDSKTADKMKSYLDANADKLTYKRASWGKEGEYDYCIDIPQHNYRSKIYTGLKRLLPPKDANDKRTLLTGKGFMRVSHSM